MNNEPIARIPFDPNQDWGPFIEAYKNLPLSPAGTARRKSLIAHSAALASGVAITSTFLDEKEIGRIIFEAAELLRIPEQNLKTIKSWGWVLLTSGPSDLVLRKELNLNNAETTMPGALTLVLPLLGVSPSQDWGLK
jgi:hypothetical protein